MKSEPQRILDEHFAETQRKCKAPDYAFGLTLGGEVVAAHNSATAFRIASMTKSFTAAALLILRDRGRMTLDQPVGEIVPELKSLRPPTTDSPAVTVRRLMTMSSGLAYDDPWADRKLDASDEEMRDLMSQGATFGAAPGTEYIYSSFGYGLLGRVITNLAGVPYHEFISSELLEPLAMTSTTWTTPKSEYAPPFRLRDGKVIADQPEPIRGDGGVGSMGGLWSTAEDILKWANFMLDAFPARDDRDDLPLRRSSRREMQQVSQAVGLVQSDFGTVTRPTSVGYGMGLNITHDEILGKLVDHTGGLPGYGSNMVWSPSRRFALVWMANITYAHRPQANPGALEALNNAGLLPEREQKPATELEPYAKKLVELLNNWDDEAARAIFLENVALDEPFERRRDAIQLAGEPPFQMMGLTAYTDAAGEATIADARQKELKLSFSLASRRPARIQAFDLKPAATERQ